MENTFNTDKLPSTWAGDTSPTHSPSKTTQPSSSPAASTTPLPRPVPMSSTSWSPVSPPPTVMDLTPMRAEEHLMPPISQTQANLFTPFNGAAWSPKPFDFMSAQSEVLPLPPPRAQRDSESCKRSKRPEDSLPLPTRETKVRRRSDDEDRDLVPAQCDLPYIFRTESNNDFAASSQTSSSSSSSLPPVSGFSQSLHMTSSSPSTESPFFHLSAPRSLARGQGGRPLGSIDFQAASIYNPSNDNNSPNRIWQYAGQEIRLKKVGPPPGAPGLFATPKYHHVYTVESATITIYRRTSEGGVVEDVVPGNEVILKFCISDSTLMKDNRNKGRNAPWALSRQDSEDIEGHAHLERIGMPVPRVYANANNLFDPVTQKRLHGMVVQKMMPINDYFIPWQTVTSIEELTGPSRMLLDDVTRWMTRNVEHILADGKELINDYHPGNVMEMIDPVTGQPVFGMCDFTLPKPDGLDEVLEVLRPWSGGRKDRSNNQWQGINPVIFNHFMSIKLPNGNTLGALLEEAQVEKSF